MRRLALFFMLIVVISAGVAGLIAVTTPAPPASSAVTLSRQFESNAFRFAYPADWSYQIPRANMLFLVSPEILQQQAGASVTMQRSLRFSDGIDTLDSVLAIYLERGPLRPDRAWTKAGAIEAAQLSGRDALFAAVEGSETAGEAPMRSEITVTQAQNGYFYIISATAPLADWQNFQPIFAAILASVTLLE